MPKKKTHEQFLEEVYSLVKDEYSILGHYEKNSIKVKIKHNICGHEYEVLSGNFLKGRRCPKCFGTPKKTHEQFVEEIFVKHGVEYNVLGQYINNNTKILMGHIKCGNTWHATPRHLLEGHGCPRCGGNEPYTTEMFTKEISRIFKDKIVLDGEYKNSKTLIKVKCLIDGCKWESIPSNLLKGCGCPRCGGNERYTTKTYKNKIFELYQDEFTILGEYSSNKILVKHNKCNYIWEVAPSSLTSGYGCPKCNESKGEKRVSKFLENNKLDYTPQYKFENCRNKRMLPFDFYIPQYNLCIEYDGELHYKVARYGDKDKMKLKLDMTQFRDKLKNKYCKDNNIKLLRIPYWEFKNIETILKSVLP
ncbi:PDDEXK family nuclease [Clostridium estertheticum]|uniref:hypothetical protein n=1 Tax=Clostridium estertheticum TaxID=238834 RepID=UPI00124F1BDB|nr:hypothetical protein [Clostridium estertheticum]MBZ9615291.1 endonuclease domain-containing protein [Clostridium estertheticum subsp. laramiense]WAG75180.1 endonuclease domain-containing protein [Clostridium estertheticum]